jgi:hypothetical protein
MALVSCISFPSWCSRAKGEKEEERGGKWKKKIEKRKRKRIQLYRAGHTNSND